MVSQNACWVPGCKNSARWTDVRKVQYFQLPHRDDERLTNWLRNIGRSDLIGSTKCSFKGKRVCSEHFDDKMLTTFRNKLKPNAIPCVFKMYTGPTYPKAEEEAGMKQRAKQLIKGLEDEKEKERKQMLEDDKKSCCYLCSELFDTKELLKEHQQKYHRKEKYLYICNFCRKSFTIRSRFNNHLESHFKHKQYVCHICEMTFNHRAHLTEHFRHHNMDTDQNEDKIIHMDTDDNSSDLLNNTDDNSSDPLHIDDNSSDNLNQTDCKPSLLNA